MSTAQAPAGLKKALSALHLWAIAVGLVISGEYFGWNYGWAEAGTLGFLIATVIITVLYVTFIFSFTELTTAIPHAGGPFAYAHRAFGSYGGLIAGYATLVEFLLATPAIAFALGSYTHFLYPGLPVIPVALGCFVIFTALNMLGIKESAIFSLFITLLAVAELLLYIGIVAPHFSLQNFTRDALPVSTSGILASLPFAIWFYLAIEGVAMVAEEVKDPRRNIPRGYIYGIVTLLALAFGVMIFTGGAGNWQHFVKLDYPLPEAIGVVLGKESSLTKLFAGIGLFGLIASFHAIVVTYSRQLYALARNGLLPAFLGKVNVRHHTPNVALITGSIIGILALVSGTTDKLIILSVMGALVMYIISMISLFRLRQKEPDLQRPMKVPFYPFFPATALLLSAGALLTILYFHPGLGIIFFAGMLLSLAILQLKRRSEGRRHAESSGNIIEPVTDTEFRSK
jgi:ethanolamine permease